MGCDADGPGLRVSLRRIMLGSASSLPIQRIATASTQNGAAGNTLTINKPTGTVEGDLLVAILCADGALAATPITLPTGWKLRGRSKDGSAHLSIAYKIAGASEGANYTFTAPVSTRVLGGSIITYRNARFGWTADTAGSGSPTVAPAVRVGASGNVVVGAYVTDSASVTFTTPTGMTAVTSNSDTTGPSWAVFEQEFAAAGSSGTKSSTPSSGTGRIGLLFTLYQGDSYGIVVPELVATEKTQNGSAGTSLVINKPAGTQEGDLLVAVMSCAGGVSWTGDTDWTEVADLAGTPSLRIAYKVAGASEPASYTFTASGSQTLSGGIMTWRNAGWDTIGSIDTDTGSVNPTVTPNFDFGRVLVFVCVGNQASKTFNTNSGGVDDFPWPENILSDADATAPSWAVFDHGPYGAQLLGANNFFEVTTSGATKAGVAFALKPAA